MLGKFHWIKELPVQGGQSQELGQGPHEIAEFNLGSNFGDVSPLVDVAVILIEVALTIL